MTAPVSRRRIIALCVVLTIAALFTAIWQIDLVRQNAEILWIDATGQQWHFHGNKSVQSFWSPSLSERRQVIVYLPPEYSAQSNASTRYPVLYLLHGAPDPGDGWDRYGRGPEDMDRLITLHGYPPMIVVCPDGNGDGTFGDSEYIDAIGKQKDGKPGKKIEQYITQDLTHWVDDSYRTDPTANGRVIAGISTGGYGAVNLGLQHPDKFATILAFSGYYRADQSGWARPVWSYHPTKAELYEQSPDAYVDGPQQRWQHTFVVLGDGSSDRPYYRHEAIAFANRLRRSGIQVATLEYPGRHSWDLWRELLMRSMMIIRPRLPGESDTTK